MGYQKAMEAAGAIVHDFEQFGSYQGDWWAKVTYNGETGWVRGSYGSCSGCDAFEAEFGWDEGHCKEHRYGSDEESVGCEACKEAKATYDTKLADFGRDYLDGIMSHEKAIERASENLDWDMEAKEMVEYLKSH